MNSLPLVGAGPSAGWNPSNILGLQLWLAADKIVGLSDGDPVVTWSDLSGQGNDVTQATPAKRPTYKVDIVNSKSIVRFDGADDFLANETFPDPSAVSAFAVAIYAVGAGLNWGIFELTLDLTTNNEGAMLFHEDDSAKVRWINAQGTQQIIGGDYSDGVARVHSVNVESSVLYYRVNGASVGTPISFVSENPYVLDTLVIGGLAGLYEFKGDIAEVIMYDSYLSPPNRLRVERYLSVKYGIALA